MNPISEPPTRNDVVQETMIRSLNVANEVNQEYAIVTYDLAVALKAYSIQALKTPKFDKLIILLGNFLLELAFFGAVGTFIANSGIEHLLTASGVLASGSLNGFIKGKFYNRCTRIHQIVAAVMERAIFSNFKESLNEENLMLLQDVVFNISEMNKDNQGVIETTPFKALMNKYEIFFHDVIKGEYGNTAAYWAIYVYLINRVYRQLQRAVRTNNVKAYIDVLPCVVDICFALNRPNYARWGSLFLHKLRQMNPTALSILEAGAMSIRRTEKNYARCSIDLTLEQTVNRDAASPMKGISAFSNSDSAFQRWSVTLTERGMALSELRQLVGLHLGEEPGNQVRKWRIKRDNADIDALTHALNTTCNPFACHSPYNLVNVSSEKSALKETEQFLLRTLIRREEHRIKFERECSDDNSRFLKTVPRIKMLNFAAENAKKGRPSGRRIDATEGVRDVLGRILTVAAKESNCFDLKHILSYPITDVPLALSHTDGTPAKTCRAALTNALESRQTSKLEDVLPVIRATVIDGGNILHEIVLQHSKSSYGAMARDLLVKVSFYQGEEIHLLFDKYQSPSIKDTEQKSRGGYFHKDFIITGPDQSQTKSGTELLRNGAFKDAFVRFFIEVTKPQYGPIIGSKIFYISHGGNCIKIRYTENVLEVYRPSNLQSTHEEADTLIAFHVKNMYEGNILVRSSDTDVLIILLGLVGRSNDISVILNYGHGNHRRYIDVSHLAVCLEKRQPGITDALIGLHALTGCDFTSSFYRKGKVKPFELLESDTSGIYKIALQSLASEKVNIEEVTSYVCSLYGFKTRDINDARYKAFLRMSGGMQNSTLSKIKRINCGALPPCSKTLHNHIKRAHFVALMWKNADQIDLTQGRNPVNYGWRISDHIFETDWFPGHPIPESLTGTTENEEHIEEAATEDYEDSDNAWSEDSDDEDEDSI